MTLNFILIALGAIAIIAGVVLTVINAIKVKNKREYFGDTSIKMPKYPMYLNIAGIIAVILSMTFQVIPSGYTGVRTTFGMIDQDSCMPGLNFTIPIAQHISLVNNKQQDVRFDGQIWSESSEQTPVYMEGVTVSYQIVPESSAWIYANVDNWVQELVDYDIVSSALKSAARGIKTNNVTNRSIIESDSRDTLQNAIDDKYGENRVLIKTVIINNMDFEESYNQAIAAKSNAAKEAEEQAIRNQTEIDRAEAEAQAERVRAQGVADAEIIKAEAKAEANQLIANSITAQTQRQDAIDKWDGVLPQATGSDVSFGILDVAGSNNTTGN